MVQAWILDPSVTDEKFQMIDAGTLKDRFGVEYHEVVVY